MNRRKFIKNTALAATLAGISPSVIAADLDCVNKNKMIFVFRGVSFSDAEAAIKKAGFDNSNTYLQKVICINPAYTHTSGMNQLMNSKSYSSKFEIIQTEYLDRYMITDVINDNMLSSNTKNKVIHIHHTEIGHSSNKLYVQTLDEFFTELKKVFDPKRHKIVITADIGRNSQLNSCGGKDHSNETSLETFAFYMGGKSDQLKSNTGTLEQQLVLDQKF